MTMSMRLANSIFLSMLFLAACSPARAPSAAPHKTKWAIAVHGGGGEEEWQHMDAATAAAYHASLARALDAGAAVLSKGGRSIDAVEAAIKAMEDDPLFNAGRGAAFDSAGQERDGCSDHGRRDVGGRLGRGCQRDKESDRAGSRGDGAHALRDDGRARRGCFCHQPASAADAALLFFHRDALAGIAGRAARPGEAHPAAPGRCSGCAACAWRSRMAWRPLRIASERWGLWRAMCMAISARALPREACRASCRACGRFTRSLARAPTRRTMHAPSPLPEWANTSSASSVAKEICGLVKWKRMTTGAAAEHVIRDEVAKLKGGEGGVIVLNQKSDPVGPTTRWACFARGRWRPPAGSAAS